MLVSGHLLQTLILVDITCVPLGLVVRGEDETRCAVDRMGLWLDVIIIRSGVTGRRRRRRRRRIPFAPDFNV